MAYTTIDLFAGAGGITEGFRKAGFRCLCATDVDEDAKRTFTYNHPDVPFLLKDIRQVSAQELLDVAHCQPGDVDVITGGPPCQGFSLAGQRLTDDPRNSLFKEYVRIAGDVQPKAIFFENVYGIMNMQGGAVLKAIVSEFERIGYTCKYDLINAADFGVPQARPRFVLIGVRGKHSAFFFPTPTHGAVEQGAQLRFHPTKLRPYVTVEDALSNLPAIDQGGGAEETLTGIHCLCSYQEQVVGDRRPGTLYNHRATRHSTVIQARYAMIPQGCDNSVLPPEIRTKKRNAYKLKLSEPSRTVTCNFRTDLLHPTMNRGLTVREAARLQSFDDDYRFFGNLTRKAKWLTQDDQVGNAVPPLLAYAFAVCLSKFISAQFPETRKGTQAVANTTTVKRKLRDSPSHKLGELVGDFLEASITEHLQETISNRTGYYLDYRHPRPARGGNKLVVGKDEQGNEHRLDLVVEKGGSEEVFGRPKAYIEIAWRGRTKHSKNKVQEISGAILPLVKTNQQEMPFYAAVLAGEFTENALQQLKSDGFFVLHFTYDEICRAYDKVGISIRWMEQTNVELIQAIIAEVENMSEEQYADLKQQFSKMYRKKLKELDIALNAALDMQITEVVILPLCGQLHTLTSVSDAIRFVTDYTETQQEPFLRYEITIRYNNGDEYSVKCCSRSAALQFLNRYTG